MTNFGDLTRIISKSYNGDRKENKSNNQEAKDTKSTKEVTKVTIGSYVRKLRKAKRMTQQELAKKAGIARSYISRLEDNQYQHPSAEMLMVLAKALEISLIELLEVGNYLSSNERRGLPTFESFMREKFGFSPEMIWEMQIAKEMVEAKHRRRASRGKRKEGR